MIDDKLIRSSGKIELLSRILPKFFATGHRVSSFAAVLCQTLNADVLLFTTGSHLLPDDEGHGYYGRFLEDDDLEVLAS